MYMNQKTVVMVGKTLLESRGVRQGCSLSLLLFIVYDEAMAAAREICHECAIGIRVGERQST